jgi:molecular chaperone HtpG
MEGYKSRFGVRVLSLALGKLYSDPSVIYREYIQNACDGLELALKEGLITPNEAVISIQIDKNEISIKDRGVGVSVTDIGPRLVDPGNSVKYKDDLIGQYGIGRLIAAQYCEKIVFETSFYNENKKTILTWNTEEAFKLIESHDFEDGTEVIDRVTSRIFEPEDPKEHYFRVRLCGIKRRIDKLVDVQAVKEYVSLIAPVGYTKEFKEGYLFPALEENPDYKELYERERIYKVVINGEDIRKPYSVEIPNKDTKLMQPLFVKFEDPDDGVLGWGWYTLNEKVRQMNDVSFRGIRFRKLNTAVGDSNVMANYMKNVSVNYFVGEIFLTHEKIQPTGSRDGFVDSEQKSEFDVIMKDKADMMYSMYDGASHMGSQAVDKMINAYLEKSKLMARLPNEDDPSEKKVIKEQIKKQEEIIKTKAIELNEKKEDLESTPEGKIVAEAVIEARQKALNEKITENNSKKSRPKIKAVSIINLIEKKQEKREAEEKQEDRIEDKKNPKDTLLSRLSKEEKKTFSKVCEVIDNEPTLTPSYMESLKTKILKKLAK